MLMNRYADLSTDRSRSRGAAEGCIVTPRNKRVCLRVRHRECRKRDVVEGPVRNDDSLPRAREPRLNRPNDHLVQDLSVVQSTLEGDVDEACQRMVESDGLVRDGHG